MKKRKTSIVILTYNNFNYTKDCVESIKKYTKKNSYEIIIVDNLSTDETRDWLKKQKDLKVILNDENKGFPKGCNQGIEIANPNNDILLLNNDTIVTTNWLENLKICLYSNDLVGAVGSVSNHQENLQGVDFTYNDFVEMQKLAKKNNISDSNQWEEKVFLIGFCILIKRDVLNKIGLLDEEYSPGYVEDNDLSLRIIDAGYKLMLCHDSFIHHYLGTAFRKDLNKFYPILYRNRTYFESRWGFNTFQFDEIKHASLRILKDDKEKPLRFLDVNCGIGATMLKIKNDYRNAEIDGIESNENMAKFAKHFGTIFKNYNELTEQDYDYIIIGNLLEKIDHPNIFLQDIKKHLKKDGFIIGEISNISSHKIILELLKDNWYFNNNFPRNNKNHFTIEDINTLFLNNGYKHTSTFNWFSILNKEEESLLEQLNNIIGQNKIYSYKTHYYSFQFQKNN